MPGFRIATSGTAIADRRTRYPSSPRRSCSPAPPPMGRGDHLANCSPTAGSPAARGLHPGQRHHELPHYRGPYEIEAELVAYLIASSAGLH